MFTILPILLLSLLLRVSEVPEQVLLEKSSPLHVQHQSYCTVILLLSAFRLHKKCLYNQLDIFLLGCMAVFMSTLKILQAYNTEPNTMTDKIIAVLLIPMPLLYSLCLGMYCIWRRSRRVQSATERLRAFFSRPKSYQQLEQFLPHL